MLRSMFSGVSGLRSHQTMMDVVGNNIANVNTTGFKSSSVVFADTMSQLTKAAGAPQAGVAGTNPSQVGLGVRVDTIAQNMTQGSAESTGKSTDLMLNGDGMFVVKQGEGTFYSRNGSFTLDATGALTTADGAYVQGWRADASGSINANGPTDSLVVPADTIMPATATTESTIKGNLDKTTIPVNVAASGATPSYAAVVSTSFNVYDAQGKPTQVTATFTNATAAASSADYAGGNTWSVHFTDPSGNSVGPATDATVTFDAAGKYTTGSAIPLTVGTPGVAMQVDASALTGAVSTNHASTVTSTSDGSPIGTLEAFSFGTDGVLTGSYSNGLKRALGQVAVASFNNYEGLRKAGNSMYEVTTNSGTPNVGVPGIGGRGSLAAGQLEMSNVDLSSEFTNLILAQRGFQANSRVITASDQILQDLVNLKQ